MIDAAALLTDTRKLADRLVDDLRERTEEHDESRIYVQGVYSQATAAGRTDKTFEEWREDLLAQVAAGWVLGCVFVRFCEDNGLHDTPLLSGPGHRRRLAGDHRSAFFVHDPTTDDRDWLREVFGRYAKLPGTSGIFGERNPLWQLSPGPDGAKALVELWWATDDEGRVLRHDFTDASRDTRFLGDLYQDLSEHARKQYALLQTPEFVEEYLLDRTLDPAIETFGLAETKMIDPTCGSGHFLLGAFYRLLERWQQAEPGTDVRELAQRALNAVNGVDINPFAVAVARFRLLVAALRASGIHRLVDAPDFGINVAAGDSLLNGTRPGVMFSGAAAYSGVLDHHYATEDAEDAEHILQAGRYAAVVGNPPYISVSDGALRDAYRVLYRSAAGHFTLVAPFVERFFELGVQEGGAGRIGMIVGNGFMRREFGRHVCESVLAERRVDLLLDTSLVDIPGHGTDTVILVGSTAEPDRTVVVTRSDSMFSPRTLDRERIWRDLVDGSRDCPWLGEYVQSFEIQSSELASHPIRLQTPLERAVFSRVERAGSPLSNYITSAGKGDIMGADEVFARPREQWRPNERRELPLRPLVNGEDVRNWTIASREMCVFPYDENVRLMKSDVLNRYVWPWRSVLLGRATFGRKTYREEGIPAWRWHQVSRDRNRPGVTRIAFSQVASHNHFARLAEGDVVNQSVRLLTMSNSVDVEAVLAGINSSAALFWMRSTFLNKDSSGELWESRFEFDAAKIKNMPVVLAPPSLSASASELADELRETFQIKARVESTSSEGERLSHLSALQEELDWAIYESCGFVEKCVAPRELVPPLAGGERAFEIALARRMATGEVSSAWFDRHGFRPATELPNHWPDGYRRVVERRLELIGSDRAIGLLERPEYKRRWNWADLTDLERDAQRTWLLERLEALLNAGDPNEPEVTTVARLADQLLRDHDSLAVLEELEGAHADPVKVVGQLLASAGVPYLAAMRLKESGLRTRHAWERTWTLQRIEDDLDARAALPADHPDHLDASALVVAKKEAEVDKIPVPPKYKAPDFRDPNSWRLRGKLDVPKERFILYPRTHLGADTSAVVGWAGWDHLEQLQALAGLYTSRKHDGAEGGELTPMLAGMAELLPWVLQWHDDPDVHGFRMGQEFTGFLDSERAGLGLTADDLTAWRP